MLPPVELNNDPTQSLREQLSRIAELEIKAVSSADFIALARMTLVVYARQPEMASQVYQQFGQNERGFIRWLRMAAEDGRLEIQDHKLAVNQFMALIKAFVFWPQVFAGQALPEKDELSRIVESTVTMFLDHYAQKNEE